jgi:ATP-dependent Clp protease ATP-binding subunit ClpB
MRKPVGTFLFLGTTGVGKTELATLAEYLFDDENAMTRIDMNTKNVIACSRLVGAPPGYVAI